MFVLRPGFGLCVSSVKIVRGHVPSDFNIFYQDGGIIGVHRWNWVTSRYVLSKRSKKLQDCGRHHEHRGLRSEGNATRDKGPEW